MANRVTTEQKRILLEYVTYEDGNTQGAWICTKCSHKAMGRPNRIVSHLLCIKDKGVKTCTYMEQNHDEREELARRLGRNPQPDQIVISMEETFSAGALLVDNNDGVDVESEMISTTHQGQPSQPGSAQPSFPQGGTDMCMDDLMPTLTQSTFDHVNDQFMPPSQDGAIADPSRALNSMDIEGQQQLQPGEDDNVHNLGEAENTGAVISNVCIDLDHHSNVPDLGSGGREGGASPDVRMRMQNAVNQEKGGKKRKCAPGSGTSATALPLDNSEQSSPISVSNSIISFSPETSDASMPVPCETCTPPSHGRGRACEPNTNNDVVEGTNDVGSEPNNSIHHEQSSQLNSTQSYSPQGGMDMGLGDQIPHPSLGNSDHVNEQDAHPLQDGAGIDLSSLGNAVGVGTSREPGLANNPPRCPPDFPSDLWDFHVRIDRQLALYETCTSFVDEADRKDSLACLVAACSDIRDDFPNASVTDLRERLYWKYYRNLRNIWLDPFLPSFDKIEREIRDEAEQEVRILATKRKMEMDFWLKYAGFFKREVDILNIDTMKAKLPTDMLQLLERVDGLSKAVLELIETGRSLLNPVGFPRFPLYEQGTSLFVDGTERKSRLACLVSACSEVRDYFTNAPDGSVTDLRNRLYKEHYRNVRKISFDPFLSDFLELERAIREQAEREDAMLALRRRMEMNCWITYAARFKTEVDVLDIDALEAKSPTDILQLLERVEELSKGVRKLIETGRSLLNPVPKDLLSWNPSFMFCRSQLQNQMLLGESPQQA